MFHCNFNSNIISVLYIYTYYYIIGKCNLIYIVRNTRSVRLTVQCYGLTSYNWINKYHHIYLFVVVVVVLVAADGATVVQGMDFAMLVQGLELEVMKRVVQVYGEK